MEKVKNIQKLLATIDEKIKFDEKNHSYTIDGENYIPVSVFIKRFIEEPDFDAIAEKLSKERGYNVREEWNKKRDYAANRGSDIHQFAEYFVNFSAKISIDSPFLGEKIQILRAIKEIIDIGHIIVGAEVKLYDKELKIAGTLDLVTYSSDLDTFFIFDHKTNKDLFKQAGKAITTGNEITIFDKYRLQLSTYKYMFEKITGEIADTAIIHITERSYRFHKVKPVNIYELNKKLQTVKQ